jgi:hypothetical protein
VIGASRRRCSHRSGHQGSKSDGIHYDFVCVLQSVSSVLISDRHQFHPGGVGTIIIRKQSDCSKSLFLTGKYSVAF